jgi:serine/threonine-protein kinase HipA
MRKAAVYFGESKAGQLIEHSRVSYEFIYEPDYQGSPVSLTMPVAAQKFAFRSFPAFFEGLLPEGIQKDALLRQRKIDRNDLFSQLIAVGEDMVGAVTVKEVK